MKKHRLTPRAPKTEPTSTPAERNANRIAVLTLLSRKTHAIGQAQIMSELAEFYDIHMDENIIRTLLRRIRAWLSCNDNGRCPCCQQFEAQYTINDAGREWLRSQRTDIDNAEIQSFITQVCKDEILNNPEVQQTLKDEG